MTRLDVITAKHLKSCVRQNSKHKVFLSWIEMQLYNTRPFTQIKTLWDKSCIDQKQPWKYYIVFNIVFKIPPRVHSLRLLSQNVIFLSRVALGDT
jgi:hypothetical protein